MNPPCINGRQANILFFDNKENNMFEKKVKQIENISPDCWECHVVLYTPVSYLL